MKSILLKLDDDLFRETEERVKELKMSRNNYIKKALEKHNTEMKQKQLEAQLAKESLLVRENSMRINAEFDPIIFENLTDEY